MLSIGFLQVGYKFFFAVLTRGGSEKGFFKILNNAAVCPTGTAYRSGRFSEIQVREVHASALFPSTGQCVATGRAAVSDEADIKINFYSG